MKFIFNLILNIHLCVLCVPVQYLKAEPVLHVGRAVRAEARIRVDLANATNVLCANFILCDNFEASGKAFNKLLFDSLVWKARDSFIFMFSESDLHPLCTSLPPVLRSGQHTSQHG